MNPAVAPVVLKIDPFFDDEEAGFSPSTAPGIRKFAEFYTDPNAERMKDGSPITQYVRGGVNGVRGVLIPHATAGGVPEGIDPNSTDDIEVNIDPQLPGQSVQLTLGQMKQGLINQSMVEAAKMVPDARTLARKRRRASTAYRIAAEHVARGDVAEELPSDERFDLPTRRATPAGTRVVHSLVQPAGTSTQVPFGPPPLQQAAPPQQAAAPRQRTGSMMAAFQPPTPAAPQEAPPPLPSRATSGVSAPSRQVTFEIQHFGEIPAFYHDIQYDEVNGKILLVYDLAFKGGTKWFPPKPVENAPPIAMMEQNGQNVVCLVSHSGMQYSYDGKEICILDVHEVGQMPAE